MKRVKCAAAVALGKMGRGIKKKLDPKERLARAKRMAHARRFIKRK